MRVWSDLRVDDVGHYGHDRLLGVKVRDLLEVEVDASREEPQREPRKRVRDLQHGAPALSFARSRQSALASVPNVDVFLP